MNEQIHRERQMHGASWHAVHEGYFADPAIAAPLVARILAYAQMSRAEMVADLGGGTGFLLRCLREAGLDPRVSLVDLDDSPAQLEVAREAGLTALAGSVGTFTREDLGGKDRRGLFVMRSVLHYFGRDGLRPVLRHLRAQIRPGEYFIHQSASFARAGDAACLNELYRMMRTPKWYPTTDALCALLKEEGWEVREVCPAPPLRLKDEDLARRYQLDAADLRRIRAELPAAAPAPADVLALTPDRFSAFLHYWIYVCTPAAGNTGASKR